MKLKIYEFKLKTKKQLVNFWYWLMKPVAYFFTVEKENARYQKKREKISHEQAVKYVAEDIAKYVVRYGEQYIIVADRFDTEYLSEYVSLRFIRWSMMKRKRARMGYYKLNMNIETQEKIIEELKKIKGIVVEEYQEEFKVKWKVPENYIKTCRVEYRG